MSHELMYQKDCPYVFSFIRLTYCVGEINNLDIECRRVVEHTTEEED